MKHYLVFLLLSLAALSQLPCGGAVKYVLPGFIRSNDERNEDGRRTTLVLLDQSDSYQAITDFIVQSGSSGGRFYLSQMTMELYESAINFLSIVSANDIMRGKTMISFYEQLLISKVYRRPISLRRALGVGSDQNGKKYLMRGQLRFARPNEVHENVRSALEQLGGCAHSVEELIEYIEKTMNYFIPKQWVGAIFRKHKHVASNSVGSKSFAPSSANTTDPPSHPPPQQMAPNRFSIPQSLSTQFRRSCTTTSTTTTSRQQPPMAPLTPAMQQSLENSLIRELNDDNERRKTTEKVCSQVLQEFFKHSESMRADRVRREEEARSRMCGAIPEGFPLTVFPQPEDRVHTNSAHNEEDSKPPARNNTDGSSLVFPQPEDRVHTKSAHNEEDSKPPARNNTDGSSLEKTGENVDSCDSTPPLSTFAFGTHGSAPSDFNFGGTPSPAASLNPGGDIYAMNETPASASPTLGAQTSEAAPSSDSGGVGSNSAAAGLPPFAPLRDILN